MTSSMSAEALTLGTGTPAVITSGVARTIKERSRAFAVRHATYCGRGLMACNLHSTDPHDVWDGDRLTTHYIVRYNGRIVGSTRLIQWNSPFGLQASQLVDLGDTTLLIEATRVALAPRFEPSREARQEALLKLLGAAVQHRWDLGHYRWVQTMRRGMAHILLSLGVPFAAPLRPIKIQDHTAKGMPLKDEQLYLGYVDLREMAGIQFVDHPEVYRHFFGTTEPLVPFGSDEVNRLRRQIEYNITYLRG